MSGPAPAAVDGPPRLAALHAGVLVGGRSTRMGQPKQLLQVRGRALVEIVTQALQPLVETLVLVGDGEVPPGLALPRVRDAEDLQGPLAGILAALRSAPTAAWLIAACDLPLLTTEAVRWLVAQRAPDRLAVLPSLDGEQVEPLLALYEPAARPVLEELSARGLRAPRWLREHPACHVATVPAALRGAWHNLNAPADLAALR